MRSRRTSGIGLLTTLQASGAARHLYPVAVGAALARARAERLWRTPAARADALAQMELLVGCTSRAAQVERLARAYLYERCLHHELVWRLDQVTSSPVQHLERLRAAVQGGKGAILSIVHQGHFGAHSACISRHGFPMSASVGPTLYGEQPRTFAGLQRQQLLRTFRSGRDVTVVSAQGSYPRLRDVLQAGGTVLLACDLPGSTPVRFLGRTVRVRSGTARLSLETGAPVLPVSVTPHGHRERLEVQPALLPAEHGTPAQLLQAVFDRHAPAVLAWPQGFEKPTLHLAEVVDPPDDPARSGPG